MRDELKDQGVTKPENVTKKYFLAKTATITDQPVFNKQGERLGEIKDLIIDIQNGRVAFGILTFGGMLGIGENKYAIPWQMITYLPTDNRYTINIDKEKLEQAETYDENIYPPAHPHPYWNGLYDYWGFPRYWY